MKTPLGLSLSKGVPPRVEKKFDTIAAISPQLVVHFQGRDKRILRNVDFAELAHLFLARLLLIQ